MENKTRKYAIGSLKLAEEKPEMSVLDPLESRKLLAKIERENRQHSCICSVCGGKLESALYLDGDIRDENGNRCFTQLIECKNEEDYRILRYCTECGLLFVKRR